MELTYHIPILANQDKVDRTIDVLNSLNGIHSRVERGKGLMERKIVIGIHDEITNDEILSLGALIGQIQAP